MTLKERILAEETKIGKFLLYAIGGVGIISSAIGEGLTYIGMIPPDWIPVWLKTTILICSVVGGVIGKLTARNAK